jgi:peptidoglycan/xylan/chitin deacetylase (PgdA/CDA1 family)
VRSVCLMYHDVYPGDAPDADIPADAAWYHVSKLAFRDHLELLAPAWKAGAVTVTFDDGWRESLSTGVECLVEAGMRGTFFVTSGFVGRRHYADRSLLTEAHAAGMEIGTHGVTHRLLSTLPEAEIKEELVASRAFLEDVLGSPVTTGSLPHGGWSPAVAAVAEAAGYEFLYTSRPGVNDDRTPRFALRRVAVRRKTTPADLSRFARLQVRREVARATVLDVPRSLLGNDRYAAVRRRVLG